MAVCWSHGACWCISHQTYCTKPLTVRVRIVLWVSRELCIVLSVLYHQHITAWSQSVNFDFCFQSLNRILSVGFVLCCADKAVDGLCFLWPLFLPLVFSCLSVCLPTCLSVSLACLSICLSPWCLSVCLFGVCLFGLSVCLSICLPVYLPALVCPPVSPYLSMSACLFALTLLSPSSNGVSLL